ncbi:hypothetical protein DACRYDRAFT_111955 [Dacryopinax primogenitus]|uniref:Uncharacterized protein n=1 Tax=Dacryopinax primogenitus (strain DJM 731) TaxID=1858805 RepID=M5G0U6_DACPD|nr:uncharacterized protein DACRYDRAFT_111955 [Dacryopinax primogenitus]EJT97412.1 hypothetical protein DACRYDRAFT_111955 [Dacryopinax primogenitus]
MAKPNTHKFTAKLEDKHNAMLKTAAIIYLDIVPFSNVVTLLLNSPQSALQEELAAWSVPPEEDEEEDEDEKEFKALLLGFLMSMASLASPLVKAEKGKGKAKEMMPAKSVMLRLNDGVDKMLPAIRVHGRLTKEDSRNVGWMPEETLQCMLCCKHAIVKDSKECHKCDIVEVPKRAVCSMRKAAKKPCSVHTAHLAKAMALPPASVEDLFLPETPEPKPVEETAKKPAEKKKQKPVCSYAPVKPQKCEQEDDKDSVGTSQKQSCLPEAEVEPPVALLRMAEHKMLELRKSLHMAQKAVDVAQKVMDMVTGQVDQVQTLLGRALAE